MPNRENDRDPSSRESRQADYKALRAEGVLPADIGASWRLEQAGLDLHRTLTEQLARKHQLAPEEVRDQIAPRLVLNLACRVDELARTGLEFRLRLQGVDDSRAPIALSSPFRSIGEIRSDRIENDPSRGVPGGFEMSVPIDVAPLCLRLIERGGFWGTNGAEPRGLKVTVDEVMDTPLIAVRGGLISIRRFCEQAAERSPLSHSPEMIETLYDVVNDPESRVLDAVELSIRFAARGDTRSALELGSRIPDALRDEVMDGGSLELRFLSPQMKGEVVALASILPAARNVLDALDRCTKGDLFSPTDPYQGRALSGREVAERAIEERVTHDISVQRRVAEHILSDHVEPREYAALSPQERTEKKNEIDSILQRRVELRREHLRKTEELHAGHLLHEKAVSSLERANYELRCFRLSKSKL